MSTVKDLHGKVGVVTGGASGIGKAIAAAMVAEGMQVMIADIEGDRLHSTAREIGAIACQTDVSSAQQVDALAASAIRQFGSVDVVCNNAGIGPMAPLHELTLNDWRWILDVNLWGVIHGVASFLPLLRANPAGGHIVNTASMAALMPVPGLVAYCASKYAVIGLSEAMAEDLAAEGGEDRRQRYCQTNRTLVRERLNPPRSANFGSFPRGTFMVHSVNEVRVCSSHFRV